MNKHRVGLEKRKWNWGRGGQGTLGKDFRTEGQLSWALMREPDREER